LAEHARQQRSGYRFFLGPRAALEGPVDQRWWHRFPLLVIHHHWRQLKEVSAADHLQTTEFPRTYFATQFMLSTMRPCMTEISSIMSLLVWRHRATAFAFAWTRRNTSVAVIDSGSTASKVRQCSPTQALCCHPGSFRKRHSVLAVSWAQLPVDTPQSFSLAGSCTVGHKQILAGHGPSHRVI
jgi:hypothetical protein